VNESQKDHYHVHLVSDATGETINSVTRACLVQFKDLPVQEHFWSLVRTPRQLEMVLDGLKQWPGLVLFTFVDEELRLALSSYCRLHKIPHHSVLEPVLSAMSNFFGVAPAHDPGKQHVLDADYFDRIEAMDYALSLDDGNKTDKLAEADVVILGVSRTSKTPTCIYLSHRGFRAANVPIVPDIPVDVDFSKLTKPLIVGLTKDPESLVETRLSRLRILHDDEQTSYTNYEDVCREVRNARALFAKIGCPVIDVSRRSIEETAAEIIMLMNERQREKDQSHDGI